MTDALNLVITTAGLQRFTAAQADDDIDLTISSVGLTAQSFVVAPTLTALPGEFRRINTISGEPVGDDIVHLMIRDQAEIAYSAKGFGLYLADGTLFAVYGQDTTIFEKSPLATLLVAVDIAFPTSDIDQLTFGDTNFLNPPATTETMGVVLLATEADAEAGVDPFLVITCAVLKAVLDGVTTAIEQRKITGGGLVTGGGDLTQDRTLTVAAATAAEADAGAVANKALTPAALVNILASIAAKAPLARMISTSGLLTGGGDLSADRALAVAKATAAMVLAGTDDASAVTPASLAGGQSIATSGSYTHPGGLIVKWGTVTLGTGTDTLTGTLSFPAAFPSECFGVVGMGKGAGANNSYATTIDAISWTAATFAWRASCKYDASASFTTPSSFFWVAVGK